MSAPETFGVVRIGAVEVAIAAQDLQEVVKRPDAITPIPLAPPYLLGAFNLRGTVVPVIHLRTILSVAESEGGGDDKIVIVSHQGATIGLVVDAVSDVVRVRPEELRRFSYAPGPYPEVVRYTLNREGGRIVHMLDLETVLQVQSMPRVAQASTRREAPARANHRGWNQYVSFACAEICCALDARAIREIIDVPQIETSVLVGGLCRGVVKLRGTIIPVVDFCEVLGLPSSVEATGQLIVMEIGGLPIGFRISRVLSILKRREDEIMGLPLFGLSRPGVFAGVIDEAGTEVLLLDHQRILSEGELHTITQGHSEIYNSQQLAAQHEMQDTGPRLAHLLFRTDKAYGAPLASVQEIIPVPQTFTRIADEASGLIGVCHLRGQVVSLVDFRVVGGSAAREPGPDAKVLLARGERDMFGFVVDAIESIETVSIGRQYQLPALWMSVAKSPLEQHTTGLVQLDMAGETRAVTLLDLGKIARALEQQLAKQAPPTESTWRAVA